MNLAEKLAYQIQGLPKKLQQEAWDFVEFLKQKSVVSNAQQDDHWWLDFSLSSATKDLEEDYGYSEADLEEKWQ